MPDLHDKLPAWLVALVFAAVLFAAGEAGFRLGRKIETPALETPPEFVLTAAFTLVALLMAFSFSMALGHYDGRSNGILREADGVRVLASRTDLLDARAARAMRADLRAYVATRLAYSDPSTGDTARLQSEAASQTLQQHMWRISADAANRDSQSSTLPLVLQSVNDLSGAAGDQASLRSAHVPEAVVAMLAAISVVSIGLMGFRLGRLGEPAQVGCAILAAMLALAVGMIVDLDHPSREFIRVGLEPLRAALGSIPP